ncbi:MAG: hypothetical protein ABIS69_00230 [Sediminibacterium sp.]
MKKMILSLSWMVIVLPFAAQAQTISTDFQKGTVLTAANEKIEGTIRDLTKSKGTITFESAGRKKTYGPAEISGFTLGGFNYISNAGDFYKAIFAGARASLYQRVSDNSGKMLYNGVEVVSITTAEGKTGDYYIQTAAEGKLLLVSQKNFETFLPVAFADCPAVVAEIKGKQLAYADLAKAVEHYNSCK